jgi:uncharacterized membrane protein YfcA
MSPARCTGLGYRPRAGVGGLDGAYTRARLQSRLPDTLIRRLVGIVVIAIGIRYLWSGLS